MSRFIAVSVVLAGVLLQGPLRADGIDAKYAKSCITDCP